MSEPTIYFPENIYYRFGYRKGRQWNTIVSPSPHGRTQRRKTWIRPKRQFSAVVFPTASRGIISNVPPYGNNDPGSGPPKLVDDDFWGLKIRPFLDNVAGRYQNFYIFDPDPHFYFQTWVGGWNGGGDPLPITFPTFMPFTFPFRGEWTGLSNAQIANVTGISFAPVGGGAALPYEPADFTIISTGGGNETVLDSLTPAITPLPPDGDYYLFVSGVWHERIPAVMTSDHEDVNFDWAAAQPLPELSIDIEEDFG